MGTEATQTPRQPPTGWGRNIGGVIGTANRQFQEDEQLRAIEDQRHMAEQRAQNIKRAGATRTARVAREVPGQRVGEAAAPRPVGGARGSVWGK